MEREKLAERWREWTAEVAEGMSRWRAEHPRATLREIEEALDHQWVQVRARIVEEAATASELADVKGAQAAGVKVACRECGAPVRERGRATRQLTTHGEQVLRLERSYTLCSACQTGHFPPG